MYKLAHSVERQLNRRHETNFLPQPGDPHIGHYCQLLASYGVSADDFTPKTLKDLLDSTMATKGPKGWYSPNRIKNPLGYLRWVLTTAHQQNLIETHATRHRKNAQKTAEARHRALAAKPPHHDPAAAAAQHETNQRWSTRIKALLRAKNHQDTLSPTAE